jgi:uncharacterized membrane protein YraQ (UPF0718 family)
MSVTEGPLLRRLTSARGSTAISHSYVMDWAAIWKDIAGGLLIAGALAAWVPESFWQGFFLVDHPVLAKIWGPLIGPLVAMLSFVCSIGNVPLAAVLWNGGISFGGVAAFIFADLIVLPIVVAYRKYYGTEFALRITALMFVTMVFAALIVDGLFSLAGLIPSARPSREDVFGSIELDYKLVLNAIALAVFAALTYLAVRRRDEAAGAKGGAERMAAATGR